MTDTLETPLRVEPQQKRSQARLHKLRTAAIALYNDPAVGRDRITTQMVATKARCSIGTVYRYWADRVAMLDDIAPNRDKSPITPE